MKNSKSILMLTAALALISSFNSRADYENRIRFLFDNRDALESRIDMIRGAQANLDISYFLIGDTNEKVSVAGLALLQKAAERGVLIRLLVDGRFNKIPQPSMAPLLSDFIMKNLGFFSQKRKLECHSN